jgi:Anti-sigma-K factor rskA
MTCDEHDELESSIAAFVLDASDAKEGDIARAHMDACPSCRELARRLTRAAVALPLAADEVKPPERLRARILAAAEATPPVRPGSFSPVKALQMARAGRRNLDPTRPSLFPRLLAAAVAAVIVIGVVIGLATWTIRLNQQIEQQNKQLNQLNARLGQQNQLINEAPAYHTLNGSGPLAGASGTVTSKPNNAPGIIFDFNGLPQLPPGKVYEVWLIDTNNHASRVGIFRPDVFGAYRLVSNRSLQGVKIVAVTVENGPNGVDQPTQTPPMAGNVG